MTIATWQSESLYIERVDFIPKRVSIKKFPNQSTSFYVNSKVINYDSIVERAIQDCLVDFQEMAAPPKVKT